VLKKFIQRISLIRSNSNDRVEAAKIRLIKQGALIVLVALVTSVLLFAMTTAWFTNVIGADDLTFRAEAWGFDGSVNVSNDPIKAAPGDSGIVSLRLENTGEVPSLATVTISKAFMDTELQKRVYFYADKSAVINGETVRKQYLTNAGGYSYGLFPGDELILEELIHTDVQLKWEWVYDVVGYYFRLTKDGEEYRVEEYLRPVEYSYDNALYDAEGNLVMVDANTDVATFLASLTATDGYPGAYQVTEEPGGAKVLVDEKGEAVQTTYGWYPIDEENNIWLCLCKKDEIARNTAWDTDFGSGANQTTNKFQARITVTGEQWLQQVQQVGDQSALLNALNANDGQVIQLSQDVVLTEPLVLESGKQATLDLNGNQITAPANRYIFEVQENAQLTVLNGNLRGEEKTTSAFHSVGGRIAINGLNISDVYEAFLVDDYKTTNAEGANSEIRITNSTLNTYDITVFISGDGTASEEKTTLLIQNSVLNSEGYIAVMGNGTATNPGRWGTDIQIIDSTVSGYYAGIYHPQSRSDMTISGSTVSGMTGIAIKGGEITVIDSKVSGTGTDDDVVDPNVTGTADSGYQDTGDGIYIESDYQYSISLTVMGESEITHVASTAYAVRVYPDAPHVRISVSGGTFDSDVTAYLENGCSCTESDGKYLVTKEN